jgi:hypothetical protein
MANEDWSKPRLPYSDPPKSDYETVAEKLAREAKQAEDAKANRERIGRLGK